MIAIGDDGTTGLTVLLRRLSMRISQLLSVEDYPHVQSLTTGLFEMQFNDVRAMLQLPLPDLGIHAGCNFAIAAVLTNLISGISTTLYKPASLLDEMSSPQCGSGRAFQGLVRDFFPYTPPPLRADGFATELYQLCRNPLAHAVGLLTTGSPTMFFLRVQGDTCNPQGWNEQELE
jgi:hypothetical protein